MILCNNIILMSNRSNRTCNYVNFIKVLWTEWYWKENKVKYESSIQSVPQNIESNNLIKKISSWERTLSSTHLKVIRIQVVRLLRCLIFCQDCSYRRLFPNSVHQPLRKWTKYQTLRNVNYVYCFYHQNRLNNIISIQYLWVLWAL